MPCAIMLGSEERELAGEKLIVAQEHAGHWAVRVALCILLFAFYILRISITVVTVCFICCSVKLPLPQLTIFFAFFFSFSSPPQQGEGQ